MPARLLPACKAAGCKVAACKFMVDKSHNCNSGRGAEEAAAEVGIAYSSGLMKMFSNTFPQRLKGQIFSLHISSGTAMFKKSENVKNYYKFFACLLHFESFGFLV